MTINPVAGKPAGLCILLNVSKLGIKIYAASFLDKNHLRQIEEEARAIVSATLARSARAA